MKPMHCPTRNGLPRCRLLRNRSHPPRQRHRLWQGCIPYDMKREIRTEMRRPRWIAVFIQEHHDRTGPGTQHHLPDRAGAAPRHGQPLPRQDQKNRQGNGGMYAEQAAHDGRDIGAAGHQLQPESTGPRARGTGSVRLRPDCAGIAVIRPKR